MKSQVLRSDHCLSSFTQGNHQFTYHQFLSCDLSAPLAWVPGSSLTLILFTRPSFLISSKRQDLGWQGRLQCSLENEGAQIMFSSECHMMWIGTVAKLAWVRLKCGGRHSKPPAAAFLGPTVCCGMRCYICYLIESLQQLYGMVLWVSPYHTDRNTNIQRG